MGGTGGAADAVALVFRRPLRGTKMAGIFLSYVREDEHLARALAELLEEGGHSVWWDRHIRGGAQFTHEIEAALKAASKVVVLWSEASAQSAWVRDEAAAGRDSGRLIPVTVDGTEPPLGFRQYHSIDFTDWRGRGHPADFGALVAAIEGEPKSPSYKIRARRRRSIPRVLYVIPLLITLSAIAAYLLFLRGAAAAATVAVQATSADPASTAAARDLSAKLAGAEAASIGSFRLIGLDPGERRKPDLLVGVSARPGTASSSRELSIVSGANGTILWAAHFEQPNERSGDLAAQLGITAARVIQCALEAVGEGKRELKQETLKLYLSGCAKLAEEFDETATGVSLVFEKIIRQAPWFTPAWDRLLYSEAFQSDGLPNSPALEPLRRHLGQAHRLQVQTPGVYLAEAAVLRSNRFFDRLQILERGLRRYPDSPMLESAMADWLMRVGRQNDAVDHARRASELDPVSPAQRMRYVWTLAHSGKPGALIELERAERLWPGASNIELARFSYELRYGDPRAALRMIQEGKLRWGQDATTAFLEARANPTKANIDRAVAAQMQLHRQVPVYISGLVTTLATFGRNEEALGALLAYQHPEAAGYNSEGWFRAPMRGMRRDARFIQAMAHVGLLDYWKRSGKWPDFCFEPDLPYDCKKEAARYT